MEDLIVIEVHPSHWYELAGRVAPAYKMLCLLCADFTEKVRRLLRRQALESDIGWVMEEFENIVKEVVHRVSYITEEKDRVKVINDIIYGKFPHAYTREGRITIRGLDDSQRDQLIRGFKAYVDDLYYTIREGREKTFKAEDVNITEIIVKKTGLSIKPEYKRELFPEEEKKKEVKK